MAAPAREGPQHQAEYRPGRANTGSGKAGQPALDGIGEGGEDSVKAMVDGGNYGCYYPESGVPGRSGGA